MKLDTTADLRAAPEARAALLRAFSENGAVEIDTAAMESCDVAFLQVLIAASRLAKRDGHVFTLRAPMAPALLELLETLGLRPDADCQADPRLAFWSGLPQ